MKATQTAPTKSTPLTICLEGQIVEGVTDDLVAAMQGVKGRLRLDMDGVTVINSTGIKEWIRVMSPIGKVATIEFAKCHPSLIMTMNMVKDFMLGGTVASAYAQFSCEGCRTVAMRLLELPADIDPLGEPRHPPSCVECGTSMELEPAAEEYFGFLHDD